VFNIEIPEFFVSKDIKSFFEDELTKLASYKNSDYFRTEALTKFIELTGVLEDRIIDFVNVQDHKLKKFDDLQESSKHNTEILRDLQDQLIVFKLSRDDYEYKKDEPYMDDTVKNALKK
jgi:hypothetical protein